MLLVQFSTMVVDRALYLRKTVLGKLAFQVVLVLAIHVWMFFILPAVTERCVLAAAGRWTGLTCRDMFVVPSRAPAGFTDLGAPAAGLRSGALIWASCPT